MDTKPDNCIVWGERNDTDTFLQASDAHLFTSNMELNPLSIKESLEYSLPTFIFDLHTYMGKYENEENVFFLTGDIKQDANQLLITLGLDSLKEKCGVSIQTKDSSILTKADLAVSGYLIIVLPELDIKHYLKSLL
jgi:hypothetical protein